jgi:hypothetical protein
VIFKDETAEAIPVVDTIKLSSWKWWLGRAKSSSCCLGNCALLG